MPLFNPAASKAFKYLYTEPAGTIAATMTGRTQANSNTAGAATGTVYVNACPVDAGKTVSNLSLSVVAAESGGTHAWVGIADSSLKILAVSADNAGAAYFGAAGAAITTAVTVDGVNPLVTAYEGLYYLFYCVVATGMPTFAAMPAVQNIGLTGIAPVLCGSSSTGQTTPPAVGTTLGALTAMVGQQFYAWLT